jgi:hypothetical protein
VIQEEHPGWPEQVGREDGPGWEMPGRFLSRASPAVPFRAAHWSSRGRGARWAAESTSYLGSLPGVPRQAASCQAHSCQAAPRQAA